MSSSYTTSSAGIADIRFGVDYSNIDIFAPVGGSDFLFAAIPPSPRGGGTTTGAFLSANNNSLVSSELSFASISPIGVNVGTGTANPNYVMRVDVFHSTGEGIDDGSGNVTVRGTTNYSLLGINQANTTVQVGSLNAPGSGNLSGQGLGLAITADTGAAEDYMPNYGGANYRDRPGTVTPSQFYTGDQAGMNTGLIGNHLNNYWLAQGLGFELVDSDANPANNLNVFTGDSLFFSPDPTNTAGFLDDGSGADREILAEKMTTHSDPFHLTPGSTYTGAQPPAFLRGNDTQTPGVPYNKWATHELYWVDGTFTYVINYQGNSTPVLQITPQQGTNVFDAFSSAGTGVLAFWDRFGGSIALDPDGGNFVIYDNLEFEVASAGDVPDMNAYLAANGLLLSSGVAGDFDGDGDVDGNDFLVWQRGNSPTGPLDAGDLAAWQGAYAPLTAAATAVPEPASMLLLLGMAGCSLCGRRRS
ncbi:PEP-CTERM sorting domain-containing protein [Bythopirellula polymerisocia]|nr:PEP-CTERM sorting domain-containing protein [Bythopirellula polymerisocia]